MTTISAKMLAYSMHAECTIRIASYELTYPAFFHQDLMTHRDFSRSASSTRAIPMREMLRRIWKDMAKPTHWGKNKPGMQASEELVGWRRKLAIALWVFAGYCAMVIAWCLNKVGVHKQVGNMLLWPFMHFQTIVTATEFSNFFALRNHKDARPELQTLARRMFHLWTFEVPILLKLGEWHLIYILPEEKELYDSSKLLQMSAARAARVSYLNHEGKRPSLEEDKALFKRLVGQSPVHASPTEHQATSDTRTTLTMRIYKNGYACCGLYWDNPEKHGNFVGFIQHRKTIPNEVVRDHYYLGNPTESAERHLQYLTDYANTRAYAYAKDCRSLNRGGKV